MNKSAAREFANRWKDKGDEKQHAQQFLIDFAQNVLEIDPLLFDFEKRSAKATRGNDFIDAYINLGQNKKTIIEMKSRGTDLSRRKRQSDRRMATPFEQALHYNTQLSFEDQARWIITSNFDEFWIYDLNNTGKARFEPTARIRLDELDQYPAAFEMFEGGDLTLFDQEIHKEVAVSIQATEYINRIYQELMKAYQEAEPDTDRSDDLNKLAVRLVFLLYAEDAGLLVHKNTTTDFWDYLKDRSPNRIRQALIRLFDVLNTPFDQRDPYLAQDDPLLAVMPYINGGLFADRIVIPGFTKAAKEALKTASLDFDWTKISPTIFGAMFESTMNPVTRRQSGIHYTSVENIHKVIDPLFLDELKAELEKIKKENSPNRLKDKVIEYRKKLGSLKFLDPAMGSGNFLTETFLSLRRLENEAISLLAKGQIALDTGQIEVTIDQFYGIEINGFAVAVANVAIVIAEHQMMRETEKIIDQELEFLPLRTHTGFHVGNALNMDWSEVVPAKDLNYIIGNPPFIGYTYQSKNQKLDMKKIIVDVDGKPGKMTGKLDYVSAWFFKAAEYMKANSELEAAFVSTNSITMGDQVAPIWEPLIKRYGLNINFAWTTFVWNNEAKNQAHVHCVIIGFGKNQWSKKRIYNQNGFKEAESISPYLIPAKPVFIKSRTNPISPVLPLISGNRPADGGNLIIKDKQEFLKAAPAAEPYIKRLVGAEEYINNKDRWCLWLVDAKPEDLRKIPEVMNRIEKCKEDRLNGADDRKKLADTPHLFRETKNPESYLLIPVNSSSRREYIPIGFEGKDVIPTNKMLIIPGADNYYVGILLSSVHMIWNRIIGGRLKSDYQYSAKIVYNNFPWPEPTDQQRAAIEKTAQGILEARKLYPDSSLADLYDPLTMPSELLKAHQANDRAVMKAYGFKPGMSEDEVLARLFEMYQAKVDQ